MTHKSAHEHVLMPTQRGTGMGVVDVLESADTPDWCDAVYLAMKAGWISLPASPVEVDAAVKALITYVVMELSLAPDWQNGVGWARDDLLAACRARL